MICVAKSSKNTQKGGVDIFIFYKKSLCKLSMTPLLHIYQYRGDGYGAACWLCHRQRFLALPWINVKNAFLRKIFEATCDLPRLQQLRFLESQTPFSGSKRPSHGPGTSKSASSRKHTHILNFWASGKLFLTKHINFQVKSLFCY